MCPRPRISWADLRGASVGIWGVGVEGGANLRRAVAEGATTVLVDDHPDSEDVLATAEGGLDTLLRCDVVVKTPGISRYRPEVARLEAAGIPVAGGLGLWLQGVLPARVACVTGTKGKSTTTAICGHLLRRLGYDAATGGNIGRPPYDPGRVGGAAGGPGPSAGREMERHDIWVIETSSFQATDVATSPPVVVVTSLHPDHLDWHGDTETYFRDKLSLCSQPGAGRTLANGADPLLHARRALLGPHPEWVTADAPGPHWSDALGLLGQHNRTNAEFARACLRALGVPEADEVDALAAAAQEFPGLPSRLELVTRVGKVDVVDDSLSTNVLPAVSALRTFPDRRVAMIVGGHDRGIDYEPLAAALAAREVPTMVATLPANGPHIRQVIDRRAQRTETADYADMDQAVAAALEWAEPDGVLLLSPAAPSFGQFRDYRERSSAFRAAVTAAARWG